VIEQAKHDPFTEPVQLAEMVFAPTLRASTTLLEHLSRYNRLIDEVLANMSLATVQGLPFELLIATEGLRAELSNTGLREPSRALAFEAEQLATFMVATSGESQCQGFPVSRFLSGKVAHQLLHMRF
jgi:hypothetical protein